MSISPRGVAPLIHEIQKTKPGMFSAMFFASNDHLHVASDRGHAHFIVCMRLLFEGGYYLKDRFNYEYLILRFGYPSHFAGTLLNLVWKKK